MSDTENTDAPPKEKKRLGLSRSGRLEMTKTTAAGQVRQSFSHGRSRAVAVEVKRKRSFERGEAGRTGEADTLRKAVEKASLEAPFGGGEAAPVAPAERPAGIVLRTLTEEEKAVRAKALDDSRKLAEEARREAEAEAGRRAVDAERLATEHAEALRRGAEEEARKKAEDEARRKAEEEAARRLPEEVPGALGADGALSGALGARRGLSDPEAARGKGGRVRQELRRPGPPMRRSQPRRRGGKLTIAQALDDRERVRSLAAVRRQREREKRQMLEPGEEPVKVIREVVIPEAMTVQELASRMAVRGAEVVKSLMNMGQMATINQTIDGDTAELLVVEFGHKAKRVSAADVEIGLAGEADEEGNLKPRPPVVTVMGHVDHGKTTLLDALRETNVVAGEAGGITQHIGAYQVEMSSGAQITFLDTPGHEAFTSMRARGASVTDIVVLVVAADDGIMPQTVEAIDHAKAAGVPLLVAINKIDKPSSQPERVRQELLKHEVVPEELGGETLAIEISAKEKTNLDKLEEAILLQAELLDLKANPDRPADGVAIEARIDQRRGVIATVLIKRGTLRLGDVLVIGNKWGRVRALINDKGRNVEEAGPSTPIQVLGLNEVPEAGDEMNVVESERRAREVTDFREARAREARVTGSRATVEELLAKLAEGEASELPVVVKADVQGSVEALSSELAKLANDEVCVRVLHAGVGGINESDVTLAQASEAVIIGFNVRANRQARDLSRQTGVEMLFYTVIYEFIDEIKARLSGMLEPERLEKLLGVAEILEVFSVSKAGKIAGCRIVEGLVRRGAHARLLRDEVVVHDGVLANLKRFKEDAKEVKEGYECGMAFESYQDFQPGDKIEVYEIEEVARTL